jgi:hypothetical protein
MEGINDQIPGAGFFTAVIIHFNIHPKAFEVSCRARAWKYPILFRNTPLLPGPPYPSMMDFGYIYAFIYSRKICLSIGISQWDRYRV